VLRIAKTVLSRVDRKALQGHMPKNVALVITAVIIQKLLGMNIREVADVLAVNYNTLRALLSARLKKLADEVRALVAQAEALHT